MHDELLAIADELDREAAASSRPTQLYHLERLATRLRQIADRYQENQ